MNANPWAFGAGNRYIQLEKPQQQQPEQQQSGMPPIGLIDQFSGGNIFGGGASTGGAASGGGASSGAGGAGGALASAGPWAALAAAIALNENYQGNIGNREGESFPLEYGLTGRALYKDAPGWGEKADEVLPGLGSGIRTAGLLSSPADMFRGDTYKNLFKEAKSGGLVGGLLKGLF